MSITSVKSGSGGISLALDNNYMEPIATAVVGSGGTNSVIFNDIPQNYKHLQIRGIARTNRSNIQGDYVRLIFNSDVSSNYTGHDMTAWNGTVGSGVNLSFVGAQWNRFACDTNAANVFGGGTIDILDYTNINKYKTTRSLCGWDDNTAGQLQLNSALWMNTNAITSIRIIPGGGTMINQYSRFSLYGIKG